MKTTLEDAYQFVLKAFCYIALLAFVTVSLYAFQNMSPKDREFIIIMMMMSQQQ